jgi:hypothetical protein
LALGGAIGVVAHAAAVSIITPAINASRIRMV